MCISIVLACIVLYERHGIYGMIPLAILIALVPVQWFSSQLSAKYLLEKNQYNDQRVRLCKEIIEGIRTIKMYVWEFTFLRMVRALRSKEIEKYQKSYFVKYFMMGFSIASGLYGPFIMFVIIYVFSGPEDLNSSKMFSSIQLVQ